jgi:hypothetical protein
VVCVAVDVDVWVGRCVAEVAEVAEAHPQLAVELHVLPKLIEHYYGNSDNEQ